MDTINKEEIQKFSKMADEWWDVNGKFKPLHMFNPTRISYILDITYNHFNINKTDNQSPLKNLKILDIGCGGGLISEPMCRLGAQVTGIDPVEKNIKIVSLHAKRGGLKINYINSSPEKMDTNNKFDVILNLEVIEHVDNVDLFLESCKSLLNKNGIMFIATINRTFSSYIKAIIGAEYILRWLPIGTHDWNKFIKPEELEDKMVNLDFSIKEIKGLVFNPILKKWNRSENLSVNYIMAARNS